MHSTEMRVVWAGVGIVVATLVLSALLGCGMAGGVAASSAGGVGGGIAVPFGKAPPPVPPMPNRPCL